MSGALVALKPQSTLAFQSHRAESRISHTCPLIAPCRGIFFHFSCLPFFIFLLLRRKAVVGDLAPLSGSCSDGEGAGQLCRNPFLAPLRYLIFFRAGMANSSLTSLLAEGPLEDDEESYGQVSRGVRREGTRIVG